MFQKLGMNPQKEISSQNVAAVIVTAKLPAFGRIGRKTDITVSSIGDAFSLAGGTLLVTPMKAGDGNIYAIASGPLSMVVLNKGLNLQQLEQFLVVQQLKESYLLFLMIKNQLDLQLKTLTLPLQLE